MDNQVNYWLIPMDFEMCDFQHLRKEWEDRKKIKWEISHQRYLNRNKEKANPIRNGDIVFFYVTNLPTTFGPNRELSRILLRGEVCEEAHETNRLNIYPDSDCDCEEVAYAISIGHLTTLPAAKLLDDNYLSLEHLRKADPGFTPPQGKAWKNRKSTRMDNSGPTFSKELLKLLKDAFPRRNGPSFSALINHFFGHCFFEGRIGRRQQHETFMSRDNSIFFERHHFIPQCLRGTSTLPNINALVDDPRNIVHLCPICHSKIHNGKKDVVKKMVEMLLQDETIRSLLEDPNYDFFHNVGGEKAAVPFIMEKIK